MFEEKSPEELRIEIARDIGNMFTSLEVLDGRMRNYTLDPKNYPRPDYERYNNLILNYEKLHPDGWNTDLRSRYERLLEKRACYEDIWVRWCEDTGVEYMKPGRQI